jgi:GT2 family glycosyltransferase
MAKARRAVAVPKLRDSLDGSFHRCGERSFEGYVLDVADLTKQFTVDILVDGCVARTTVANEYRPELAARSDGDSYHGFSCSFSGDILENASVIEARLSNLDRSIGSPISISEPYEQGRNVGNADSAQWLGGLRFSGSTSRSGATAPLLAVIVDGERVSEVRALGWAHIDDGGERGRAVRAFDFQLPERFADGCVHRVTIVGENGQTLGGAPLTFVAFADGLAKKITELGQIDSERLRGELFDLLLPMSIQMSHYDKWRERFPIEAAPPTTLKVAVVLIGSGDIQKTLPSLEEQTHLDWVAAPIEGKQPNFDPIEIGSFLDSEAKQCEFVVFAWSGTVFAADALARMANAFQENDNARIVYGDIDLVARGGRLWPLAFPAFDYERMLEQGYCAHVFAMRRPLAEQLLADGASNLYRLFNSAFDGGTPDQDFVLHLPGALASIPPIRISAASASLSAASADHLLRRGIKAQVSPGAGTVLPAAQIRRKAPPGKTTIIIPTRNRQPLLKRCLKSILPAIDSADADVLIVDNGSTEPEALEYLAEIADKTIRVLRAPGPFNFARLNNVAVHATRSEYLCLLNNDVEAIDDIWLDEMLGRLVEPDVGAVGALLFWPSGVVQHGGVVLGPSFAAHHAFNDRVDADPGYGDLLRVAHECSAVTAACMLTRRSDYLGVSGMDEAHFAIAFNDVDYCLKLRASGKRVVFTPHAKLWHLESASRGKDDQPDRKSRFQRELRSLRAKWSQSIIDDPCYNPVLSLDSVPWSALAWPPRVMKPRGVTHPVANEIPSGF